MRNYFIFDGVDSRSFGVYISGQGTFKSPARSYDAIQIPGKNGDLLGVDSQLENVTLTYPAFIYANFKENIAAFRAFLLSHKGYFRLTDSYHPDEYRLAYYPGPLEPDVTSANNAGSFDITFICKPQRYLLSGDEVVELTPSSGQSETYTGDIVEIQAKPLNRTTSLKVPITPAQDLHGYPHPWPGGGGKNLFDLATCIKGKYISETGVISNDAGTMYTDLIPVDAGSEYTFSGNNSETTQYYARIHAYDSSGSWLQQITFARSVSGRWNMPFTVPSGATYIRVSLRLAATECQVEAGSTATIFEPYSNVCPISGRTGLNVWDDPKHGGTIKWNQLINADGTGWSKLRVSVTADETKLTFAVTNNTSVKFAYKKVVKGHKYYYSGTFDSSSNYGFAIGIYNRSDGNDFTDRHLYVYTGENVRFAHISKSVNDNQTFRFQFSTSSTTTAYSVIENFMLCDLTEIFGAGNEPATVEEFEALFPKDYYPYDDSYTETCVSAVNGDPYTKVSVDWTSEAGTVYGGTLDVVSGLLTVDRVKKVITSVTDATSVYARVRLGAFGYAKDDGRNVCNMLKEWAGTASSISVGEFKVLNSEGYNVSQAVFKLPGVSTTAEYNQILQAFNTSGTPLEFLFELSDPIYYQLTPQGVALIPNALNYIWSDAGEVTVEVMQPVEILNPTRFDALPLLRVFGTGNLSIGSHTITITAANEFTDIDCEIMDCFKGSENKNRYVQFSGNDFPTLKPGKNIVTFSGITKVDITPRWWTV